MPRGISSFIERPAFSTKASSYASRHDCRIYNQGILNFAVDTLCRDDTLSASMKSSHAGCQMIIGGPGVPYFTAFGIGNDHGTVRAAITRTPVP